MAYEEAHICRICVKIMPASMLEQHMLDAHSANGDGPTAGKNEPIERIDVLFQGERNFLVLIETGSRVLSFVLSPEQRNQLVYQLMNPDCE